MSAQLLASRIPDVVTGLVALVRTVGGHRAFEDPGSLPIAFDGPEYELAGDHVGAWLCIGWSGEPDAPESAGDGLQNIAALGNRSRDEVGSIRCRACAQTGDRDMAAARRSAFDEMKCVEDLCRANPTLGLDQTWMNYAEVAERYSYRQEYTAGALVTVDFIVVFKARI